MKSSIKLLRKLLCCIPLVIFRISFFYMSITFSMEKKGAHPGSVDGNGKVLKYKITAVKRNTEQFSQPAAERVSVEYENETDEQLSAPVTAKPGFESDEPGQTIAAIFGCETDEQFSQPATVKPRRETELSEPGYICGLIPELETDEQGRTREESQEHSRNESASSSQTSSQRARNDVIDSRINELLFKSANYRLFFDEPRDLEQVDKVLDDQEYKEQLRQKLDTAILNKEIWQIQLILREMSLFDKEKKYTLKAYQQRMQKKNIKRNRFIKTIRNCLMNSSITACGVIIIVAIGLLLKYL